MPRLKKPPYVHAYKDRHGKERIYLNKPGTAKIALPGPLYSEAFFIAYHKSLEGGTEAAAPTASARIVPGSIADLLRRYYSAPEYTGLAPSTQANYRRLLENFADTGRNKPVKALERIHIKAIIGKMNDRPQAANSLLKRLKVLMNFALDIGFIDVDPTRGMKGVKVKSEGFHTWTDEEVAKYEARHPVGSKARLAMALMLYTGQRRSDIVAMGWQHIKGGFISVRQQKTKALLEIPIHPQLKIVLEGTPRQNMTFLVTAYGKPFTGNGFGNWMRDRCDEAGLPNCSAHGLRKAMATRLAEAGCTTKQIMAITGHETEGEAIRYAKKSNQRTLAVQAMNALPKASV